MLDKTESQKVKFPAKALPLFTPAAYKVMYGGRGAAKSWAAARALLILAGRKKLFILCAREIQKSIEESVYKLLVDQIHALGLEDAHEVTKKDITNKETGSRFAFAGIRNNINTIRSMEGVDICFVEEANNVSGHSWEVLLPTIRKDPPGGPFGQGSEVWIVFNPELASDFTYKYWTLEPPGPFHKFVYPDNDVEAAMERLAEARARTVLMEMNWRDNEWFPEMLRLQKEDMRKKDYESYLTVWEGQVRRVVKGAIYAKEIERATREGRISPNVLVDRSKPVDLGIDLGRADMTSIWFMQQIGMKHYAIDYYGNFGFDWEHYLEEIQKRKYVIGKIYLPHDAKNKHVDAKKSIYQQTKDAYPSEGDQRVIIVPRTLSVVNDINAVRQMWPRLYINENTCADGLLGLAHYRFEVDDQDPRDISDKPLHDWASNPADGLRTYVMGLRDHARKGQQQFVPPGLPVMEHSQGWMAR